MKRKYFVRIISIRAKLYVKYYLVSLPPKAYLIV